MAGQEEYVKKYKEYSNTYFPEELINEATGQAQDPAIGSIETETIEANFIFSNDQMSDQVKEYWQNTAGIKKPSDFKKLKKVLSEVVSINWQYHTNSLNKDNFLLRL